MTIPMYVDGKIVDIEPAPIESLDQEAVAEARRMARQAVEEARARVEKLEMDREREAQYIRALKDGKI